MLKTKVDVLKPHTNKYDNLEEMDKFQQSTTYKNWPKEKQKVLIGLILFFC